MTGIRRRSGLGTELSQECVCSGLRVQNIGRGKPRAAQLRDAITHLVQFLGRMGVGVDDNLAAMLFSQSKIQVIQIRSCRRGIVLDGDSSSAARLRT